MFDNNIVLYKFVQDLHFYVTGGEDENELILAAVLQGFFDSVSLLLRGNVDKREALENLDLIFLCLDEIIERGMILETDANVIAGKVAVNSMDPTAPLSEQTIGQALATAREHLTRTLFQWYFLRIGALFIVCGGDPASGSRVVVGGSLLAKVPTWERRFDYVDTVLLL
ncbi:ZETA-COAT PROTEIN [Salix koriyanagi]|uniref:Coatomer subunit zeta n=1 Tax=Salix koriyanagi TaxID=2511006 RepID=A0A9Q0T4Q3_9ROSI|nr:ZETA-COAT PROTEIN [Salix koriyanagi]